VSREEWSKRQAAAQQQRDRLGERALAGQPAGKPADAPAPEKK